MKSFRLFASASLLLVLVTACTRSRQPAFPDDQGEYVFAISEFGGLDASQSKMSVQTTEAKDTPAHEKSLAVNENNLVDVDTANLEMPERFRYMFNDLAIPGQAGTRYRIVFGVDNKFVTAYKVVSNPSELTRLERAMAVLPTEVETQIKLLRARNTTEIKSSRKNLDMISANREAALKANRASAYLVPVFNFAIQSLGVVERTKNEVRKETSTLQLRETDFAVATHVKISLRSLDRTSIFVNPTNKDTTREIFVAKEINRRYSTAAELRAELNLSSLLSDDTPVYTVVDGKLLRVYEITSLSKANLRDSETALVKNNVANGRVFRCAADVAERYKLGADCVFVQRIAYDLTYIKPTLKIGTNGTPTGEVDYSREVAGRDSVGLIRIKANQVPIDIVEDNTILDPRKTLRISDIANKEFFFRRTLSQATATGPMFAGLSGPVLIGKFTFDDDALVFRRAERAVQYKSDNRNEDNEVILSLPVKYLKASKTDFAGNPVEQTRYYEARRGEAEYAQINWGANQLASSYTPIDGFGFGRCLRLAASDSVTDVSLNLNEGGISFVKSYTASLDQSCLQEVSGSQGYGRDGDGVEFTHDFKEVISFKANDHSTDKAFAPSVPFSVQKTLGYGAFTLSKLTPTANGLKGREDQELNYPGVHDFRNGKVLTYIVGGLPEREGRRLEIEGEKVDLRELYLETVRDVIKDWNSALHIAFKNTDLDRSGDYIALEVNGENGVMHPLGEVGKNFIWFDETNYMGGPIGISQAGSNPRSGIAVSDYVVIYSASARAQLESFRKRYQATKAYNVIEGAVRAETQKQADAMMKQMAEEREAAAAAAAAAAAQAATAAGAPAISGVNAAPAGVIVDGLPSGAPAGVEKGQLRLSQLKLPAMPSSWAKASQATTPEQMLGRKSYIYTGLDKIMKARARTAADMQYILINEMLPANRDGLSTEEALRQSRSDLSVQEADALAASLRRVQQTRRLEQMGQGYTKCALTENDLTSSLVYDTSYSENLKVSLRWVLAHELGHSLSLTHNFAGSSDKANFRRAGEAGDDMRVSSSVMDYLSPDAEIPMNVGPYDIHAIRAAYTGLVETNDGKDVSVLDIKKAYSNRWTNIMNVERAEILKKFNLRKFNFCTDVDVLWDVTCDRFDLGSTPLELMKNIEVDYTTRYRNDFFAYDRYSFTADTALAAQTRVLQLMIKARMVLNDLYYARVTGNEAGEKELAPAAKRAYNFLLGILGTPDTDKSFDNFADRLRPVVVPVGKASKDKVGADGQPIVETVLTPLVIESRPLLSIRANAADPSRFSTIGMEDLKLFAINLLTTKDNPSPKYEERSINASFVNFERDFLQVNQPQNSMILGSLFSMLRGQMPAFAVIEGDDGDQAAAPLMQMPITVTQNMTVMSAVGAIIRNDTGPVPDMFNFASLFKVITHRGTPFTDRPSVARIGSVADSKELITYGPNDNADFARVLITEASRIGMVFGSQKTDEVLVPAVANIYKTLLGNDREAVLKAQIAYEEALKQLGFNADNMFMQKPEDLQAGKEAEYVGNMLISVASGFVNKEMDDAVKAMAEIIKGGKKDESELTEAEKAKVEVVNKAVTPYIQSLGQMMKNAPITFAGAAAMNKLLVELAKESPEDEMMQNRMRFFQTVILSQVMPVMQEQAMRQVKITTALNFMSRLTQMTSPELSSH